MPLVRISVQCKSWLFFWSTHKVTYDLADAIRTKRRLSKRNGSQCRIVDSKGQLLK